MGGLDVIDGRFAALAERAFSVLSADDRVVSVQVGGSVGAGTADEWSDLDLEIVVTAEQHEAFLAEWPTWLAEITPTVFARTPIAPFVINTVTAEGLTVDLVVYPGEVFTFSPPSGYAVGLLSGTRFDDVGDAVEYAVAEQLRGLAGPFVSLIQRNEHLKHLAGVPHLLGLLTTVFLAESGRAMPPKLWNPTFTAEQLDTVASLPGAKATRESMIAFGLGVAELVVTRARPLFAERGLTWPEPLAGVVAQRLRDCLGIDTTAWLH